MPAADAAPPPIIAVRGCRVLAPIPTAPEAIAKSERAAPFTSVLGYLTRCRAKWPPRDRISTPWVYAEVTAAAATANGVRKCSGMKGILGRQRPRASLPVWRGRNQAAVKRAARTANNRQKLSRVGSGAY